MYRHFRSINEYDDDDDDEGLGSVLGLVGLWLVSTAIHTARWPYTKWSRASYVKYTPKLSRTPQITYHLFFKYKEHQIIHYVRVPLQTETKYQ